MIRLQLQSDEPRKTHNLARSTHPMFATGKRRSCSRLSASPPSPSASAAFFFFRLLLLAASPSSFGSILSSFSSSSAAAAGCLDGRCRPLPLPLPPPPPPLLESAAGTC